MNRNHFIIYLDCTQQILYLSTMTQIHTPSTPIFSNCFSVFCWFFFVCAQIVVKFRRKSTFIRRSNEYCLWRYLLSKYRKWERRKKKHKPINKCASTRIEWIVYKNDNDERTKKKRVCARCCCYCWNTGDSANMTACVDSMVTRVFTVRCTIEYWLENVRFARCVSLVGPVHIYMQTVLRISSFSLEFSLTLTHSSFGAHTNDRTHNWMIVFFLGGIEIHIRFNRVIANNFFISIKSMLILYKRMLPLFFSMYVYININSSFDFSLSRSLFNSFTLLLCSLSVWHCWWTLICMFNGVRVWTGWIIRFSKRQMVTADYPRQRHTYQTNVL